MDTMRLVTVESQPYGRLEGTTQLAGTHLRRERSSHSFPSSMCVGTREDARKVTGSHHNEESGHQREQEELGLQPLGVFTAKEARMVISCVKLAGSAA